jgi:uncharacterized protein involved in outer membrane biogenesis
MTTASTSLRRRRPLLIAALAALGLVIVLLIAGGVALATIDFRPILERRLSQYLDRPVQIGALHLHWGDPFAVEVQDLHLANAGWGSTPDMLSIRQLQAEIDARALLAGRLRFRKLVLVDPVLVLERNPDGIGNWRFARLVNASATDGDKAGESPVAPVDAVTGKIAAPSNRAHFPTLLDFTLHGGKISYRTSSGHVLKIDLDQVAITTPDDDQPVLLAAKGAYNGAALSLQAQLHSFNAFRDAATPYGVDVTLARQSASVHFTGTLVDPLNVDGAVGPITIAAKQLNDLLTAVGTSLPIDPALVVTGQLQHDGNLWSLSAAKGQVAGNQLAGQVHLREGGRGQADDIALDLRFKALDLDALLATGAAAKTSGKNQGWLDQPLETPDKASPRLVAKLGADSLAYGGTELTDIDLAGRLGPGEITFEHGTASIAGMKLQLAAALKPATGGSHLDTSLTFDQADAATLVSMLGGKPGDLSGKLSGGADGSLQGATLRQGLQHVQGSAVLSMTAGRISRDLLEKASTDIRTVFRNGTGTASISCLLGVMQVKDGLGTLQTLRARTGEATLNARGRVDFPRQSLDLVLQSDARSTGFFALDLPVRVTGDWHRPAIDLSGKSVGAQPPGRPESNMAPDLRAIIAANSCRQ